MTLKEYDPAVDGPEFAPMPMLIRETALGPSSSGFTLYQVMIPNVCRKFGYKTAGQINCFFHRRAKDGIKYNRTNIRVFSRFVGDEIDLEIENMARWSGQTTVSPICHLPSLDHFFEKVGFVYKTKTWRCRTEWAMKFEYPPGRYVNP